MRMGSDLPPVTEAQAQRAVAELFELYGWLVHVMQEDVRVGTSGIPDLMCVSPCGLILPVEMKRPPSKVNPQGRVRKAQKERLIAWRRRGAPCCVADDAGAWQLREMARLRLAPPDYEIALECCDALMVGFEWWPWGRP